MGHTMRLELSYKTLVLAFLMSCLMLALWKYHVSTSPSPEFRYDRETKNVWQVLPPNPTVNERRGSPDTIDILSSQLELMLEFMSADVIGALYHSYINENQTVCRRIVRMGKQEDGGWDVCDDHEYRPTDNCLVYSFGINYDFSFDDAMAQKYKCEVHSFDPSMSKPDHIHAPNVIFHHLGISGRNFTNKRGWPMDTFESIRARNGHLKRPIDVLKIDVEGAEWDALPGMIQTGVLNDVKQLYGEFHIGAWYRDVPEPRYLRGLAIFKTLHESGFRIFRTETNPGCDKVIKTKYGVGCNNVYFVNTRLAKH